MNICIHSTYTCSFDDFLAMVEKPGRNGPRSSKATISQKSMFMVSS